MASLRHVAKLAPAVLVGGCSLIYNPSNIDKPPVKDDAGPIDMGEVPIDVEIRADTNPIAMELTEAFPTTIDEGVGQNGARSAVVVLRGKQFVKDAAANLMVTLAPATAGAATLASFEVSGNGDYIALAVNVPVTDQCDDGQSVAVKVTVAQNDGVGGTVMQALDPAFSVTCLDELTTAPTTTAGLKPLYSQIDVSAPINITAAVGNSLILRSVSNINVGNINASAVGREPGPGGGSGGLNDVTTPVAATGPSPGGNGPDSTIGSGGGAGGGGYVVAGVMPVGGGTGGAMTGDVWISSYTTNRSSGGGAGGFGTAGTPGDGGGGGGTVELTAGGTLLVGTITADGANGTNGTGTLAPSGDGAGGTGGTVLLRSFANFTGGVVSVAKGMPGAGNGADAGASSDGRVRADLAMGTHPANAQKMNNVVANMTSQC